MELNFSFSLGKKKVEQKVEPKAEPIVEQAVVEQKPVEVIQQISVGENREERLSEKEWEARYGAIFRKTILEEEQVYAKMNQIEKPVVSAGRESIYEGFRNYNPNSNTPVPTTFNFRTLQFLQNLSIWNPHISMAVENIVSLGNTDYDIDFGSSVSESQAAKYRKIIWDSVPNWYEFSDGEDGLDNDLLTQLAVYGAISSEAVIMPNLKGVQNIVRVDPYYIRFAYDKDKSIHIPLQEIGGVIPGYKTKYPGYIELNTNTYFYIAMRRMGEMPYAIPPFCSAIEAVIIENDMIKNFQNMMRRLGMMGFLSVLVNAPQALAGESPEKYQARLSAYLEKLRPEVEKGFSRGVVMGYKDTHDFEVHNPVNPAAAESALKMIKSLVYAGVKQDPNMHGENYSVTETFGRVILEKMIMQVTNYQRSLATFKSKVFKLDLLLKGIVVPELNVKYRKSSIHDEERQEKVLGSKIANQDLLYQQGVIDQATRSKNLGYDKPAQMKPLETQQEKIAKLKPKPTKKSNSLVRLKKKLKAGLGTFDYSIPEGCSESFSFPSKKLNDFVNKFIKQIEEQYEFAIDRAVERMAIALQGLQNPTLEQLMTAMLYALIQNWDEDFATPIEDIVEDKAPEIYAYYRKNKSIFKGAHGIPIVAYSDLDYKAIDFFENLNKTYLQKFITDPDTENRMVKFIEQNYSNTLDTPQMKKIAEEFGQLVKSESWKIARIVNTNVVLSQNVASILYLDQAGSLNYTIREVMDEKTCRYCRHMHGRTFSIKATKEQFERLVRDGINFLNDYRPFVTTYKFDDFKEMDTQELQAAGFTIPPFHPYCRGIITIN